MNRSLNTSNYERDDDEIDISQLLSQLWSNKWLIVAITSLCFIMSVFYTSRQVPKYRSDALIQIDDNKGASSGGVSSQSLAVIFGSRNNASAIESALIQSPFILTPVVEQLGLNISSMPKQSFFKRHFFSSDAKAEVSLLEVPENELRKPLKLVYHDQNNVVLYNSEGKDVLHGAVDHLLESKDKSYRLKIKSIQADTDTSFMLRKRPTSQVVNHLAHNLQVKTMGGDNRRDTGLLSVSLEGADKNQIVQVLDEILRVSIDKNVEKKSREALTTLAFLKKQLPAVQKSLDDAELKLNKYRAQSGKIDIVQQAKMYLGQLAEYDNKLASLRIEEIDIAQRYTQEHPARLALERQIEEVEREKARMEQRIKALPESDQIALGLMRDVQIKSALYTNILNQIQQLEVVKAGTLSDTRILSSAKLPDRPLPTKNRLIYMASLLLGLMLSVAIIFGRKLLFPKVQDPHWTEKHFNLANTAVVPFSDEQKELLDNASNLSFNQQPLLAKANPRNLSVESLRSLRTSLQISQSCASNNIITILGISPGVGKSFVSANLAYLLATSEKRVLLIDADLRRGTTHKYLNIKPEPGFAELIQGKAQASEAIQNIGHTNLSVLPRGHYPDEPSELLSSENCKKLLQEFSKQFDLVLIDTPPVLLVTDAVLVSSLAATNYLVIGADMHRAEDIELTIKRLNSAGVNLTGSIFNCLTRSGQVATNHYKYYNYYYYESDEKKNDKEKRFKMPKIKI